MNKNRIVVNTFPTSAVDEFTDQQITELLSYTDADVVITEAQHHLDRIERCDHTPTLISLNALLRESTSVEIVGETVQLLCAGSAYSLKELVDLEQAGDINPDYETFIYTSELEVDIDLVNLDANLKGYDNYTDHFKKHQLDGSYTHITAKSPIGYKNNWEDGFTVHGGMPDSTNIQNNTPGVGELVLIHTGITRSRVLYEDMFGLKSINQVGPTNSKTLQQAGVSTIEDVANSSVARLSRLNGIGKKTGQKIVYSARAIHDNEICCFSKSGLPDESYDPIFIDIETDGLSPTMVWLIGVYDTKTNNYMPFLATDPTNKGKAITGFMTWFSANVNNRPVVAYNGLDFDFPIIYDHINQHCPEYLDEWDNTWTFDPLWWGPKCNNAIYPGRTNKLEDVTEELGWNRDDTGLSGKIVGELFTAWMENPTDKTELDWEQHKQYCKDDVLSLKHLYEQIQQAEPIGVRSTPTTPTTTPSNRTSNKNKSNAQVTSDSETKQGSLDNF